MHHQFFILFASIILILVILLAVEAVAITCGRLVVDKNWRNHIFDEFVTELEEVVEFLNSGLTEEPGTEGGVINLMFDSLSERVSGCMLRDARGKYVVSFGTTPMGVLVPTPRKKISQELTLDSTSLEPRFRVNFQDMVLYLERPVDSPDYELRISTLLGTDIITEAGLVKLGKGEKTMVYLPDMVKNQDIAGTIRICLDGEVKGYLDVLVYSLSAYRPTAFVYRQLAVSTFLCAFPLALVVAVILAYLLSRKNDRQIRKILSSLEAIAAGDYTVQIPKKGITEYDAIAESVNQLAKEMQRHQKARKEWIRNISHDLNTPVASLSLMVNGVLDGVFPASDELLGKVKAEIDTLTERIASVNYYSQLLFPETESRKEDVALLEVLDEVLEKGKYSCVAPDTGAVVYADRTMFSRALKEVIQNANDYGDLSEMPTLKCAEKKDMLVIEVRNKGSLPRPLPQFFEPWARGDSARTSGGSGLGFPIVAQIMELHGGTVTIGEEGDMVVVRLSFPVKASGEKGPHGRLLPSKP